MSYYLKDRISWSEKDGARFIAIHSQIEPWLHGLLAGWIVLWLGVGVMIGWQLVGDFEYSDRERTFFVVFLAFWAYFLYKAVLAWAWRKWGKELIRVTPDAITYKRDIRSYGRAHRYLRSNVSGIKKAEHGRFSFSGSYSMSFWVITGGSVQFQHLKKVIAVGLQLDESEAEQLAKLLSKPVRTKA